MDSSLFGRKEGRKRDMEGSPFSGTLIAHSSGDPLKGSEARGVRWVEVQISFLSVR